MANPPTRIDTKYQKFAVAPTRLLAPDPEVRPPSPIRRSGSPLRRKQIHELESLPEKRQKLTRFSSDSQKKDDMAAIDQMADAIDKISNTFAATATSLRDSKVFQQTILDEVRELKLSVAQLQKDVLLLVEMSKKTCEKDTDRDADKEKHGET